MSDDLIRVALNTAVAITFGEEEVGDPHNTAIAIGVIVAFLRAVPLGSYLDPLGAPIDLTGLADAVKKAAKPKLCKGCGVYSADPPSSLCPGCEAYQEHLR